MSAIAQEAQRMSLLFEIGVIDAGSVIDWADSQIVAADSPPTSLIELSTTSSERVGDIISHLHTLAQGADFWPAFRSALSTLHEHVSTHPNDAGRVAGELYRRAAFTAPSSIPPDLRFLYRYGDAFDLAHQGVYGDMSAVRKEFICELEKFTSAA